MAHTNLETTTWQHPNPHSGTEQHEQHAMLDTSNIQWTDDCGADGLFSSPTNYELCHSLFSPNKNAVQIGDYFDTRIFAEQGFEGWNTDSSRLVQPRSIPELNLSTIGQPSHAYPPSAFHVDAKPSEGSHQEEDTNVDTTLLDIQRSVEQDANVHANQEAYPLDLGAPALSFGHFNDLRSSHRHSPTSMLSEFSGDHGEHFDYDEMDEDNEKPYAQLIYQALLTAKDYSMQLQDIYDWIQHRTDKVKDKSGQGWRNSIRHNLSMNKAFEKTTSDSKSKKGGKNTWRLRHEFVKCGPESTTRYRRKDPTFKRPRKSIHPAPQRQASGAKGGQAARKAAEARRSMRLKEAQNHQMHDMRALDTQAYVHSPRTVHGMPYYDYSPALSEPHSALASHPNSPYFACAPALPQSFSFTQPSASIAAPKPEHIVPSQGQAEPQGHHPQYHGIDGFPAPYTPPYESGSYTNTPVMGYVDRIELRDLGDKPLFASECDSPDSASEMSLPQTPSTMGSTTDRFGGMSSGIGIDPSPFDG